MRAFHPVADIFPLIQGAEFAAFCKDVKANGLHVPIVVHPDGRILDGRDRERACEATGVEAEYETWDGKPGSEVAYVLSLNLSRRHLNESQRAMVAARLATLPHGVRSDRVEASNEASTTQREAATALNVSRPSVQRARVVLDTGDEELTKSVDEGRVTVSKGAQLATEPKKTRAAVLKKVKEGKKAPKAVKEVRAEERAKAAEQAVGAMDDSSIDVRCCSMQELLGSLDGTLDAIITDPPYPKEYLDLYGDLARLAKTALKPDGVLAVMVGQSYLPELLAAMVEHIEYRWTMAYLTPGGQSAQLWSRKVNTFWKPILLFGGAPRWSGDVVRSDVNDNDKRFHDWGQSEGGMLRLVEALTEPGMLVCDPFVGGGTTGVVSLASGRLFVGCDSDEGKVTLARARMAGIVNET